VVSALVDTAPLDTAPLNTAPLDTRAGDGLVVDLRRTTTLFGVTVDPLTMAESVDRAEELIGSGRPSHHVCINAGKLVAMRSDPYLRGVVEGADMVNVDGQSVVWSSRILGAHVPERVAGIDFMDALVARAAARGWRVFFLGGRDDVVSAAAAELSARHPGLTVAGWRSGYWKPHDEEAVVREIAATSPDLVFVGLPTPRKEYFVASHLEALGAGLVVGVGGSFDVVAGLVGRAPLWMQRAGLEWFHRLLQEPRRMWKRYLIGNAKFLALVVEHWIRGRWLHAKSTT
jgi:N-acetylglucosaminyldiphosphoundecaprenol N-acetyl-beta-D-mannosaminyltransferase